MSDYTPTTEEVRQCYENHSDPHALVKSPGKEFDRWYAKEIRIAKAEAWQEGYWDRYDFHVSHGLRGTETNPYTEES